MISEQRKEYLIQQSKEKEEFFEENFKVYDFALTKAYSYYNLISKKAQYVRSGTVFSTSDFEIHELENGCYVKHPIFSDVIVRQAECDGFLLSLDCSHDLDFPMSIFFDRNNKNSKLHKYFGELEMDFYRGDSSTRTTPHYVLPGETKPIFKCSKNIKPTYKAVQTPLGWRKHIVGHGTKGFTLQLLGGNSTIRKLIKMDPDFLPELFKSIGQKIKLQRFDVNCDFNIEIIPEILKSVKLNHYDSFGRGVYLVPDRDKKTKKKKSNKNDEQENNDELKKEIDLKKAVRIKQGEGIDTEIESKTNSIYIGNFKKSPVTIYIYNKQKQSSSVKKSFSVLKSRVEPRIYPKNQDEPEESSENPIFNPPVYNPETGKKQYQKLAQFSVNYPKEFYIRLFQDYHGKISQGLRNIFFLNSFLNGFTISPTAKNKKELTPWYVDNFVTPVLVLVEKFLLENPEFSNRALKSGFNKDMFLWRGKYVSIREPKVYNGVPKIAEEEIDWLLGWWLRSMNENKEGLIREPKKGVKGTKAKEKSESVKVKGELNKGDKRTEILKDDVNKETKKLVKESQEGKVDSEMRTVVPENLNATERLALKTDLISYLSSKDSARAEKDFLQNFLGGKLDVKPSQPQNVRYETWRRGDRAYNLPWIRLKREVFNESGLKFKRYSPGITPIEKK